MYVHTQKRSRLGDPDVAGDAGGHLALARAETNGGQLAPPFIGTEANERGDDGPSRFGRGPISFILRGCAAIQRTAIRERVGQDTRRMWLFKFIRRNLYVKN